MTNNQANWTPQQQAAIDARGDVFVSASAGTGKTAVLARRCVELITDPADPIDVSRLLVLTFTDAAAEEMRSRIGAELRRQYHLTPCQHLRRQILLIDAADITTIHAFCKRLISEHFYTLGLDPAFGIIDADEQRLIQTETLTAILEEGWNDSDLAPGMLSLLQLRPVRTGSASFLNHIPQLSAFLDGIVSRPDWYEHAHALAQPTHPTQTALAARQKKLLLTELQRCRVQLLHSQWLDQQQFRRHEGPSALGGHWSGQIRDQFLPPIDRCIAAIQADDLQTCRQIINNYTKPRWNNRPRWMTADLADTIKAPAKRAVAAFEALAFWALMNTDYESVIATPAAQQTQTLLELLRLFDRQYHIAKTELNRLDFADLEHCGLELLRSTANPQGHNLADRLRRRYRYIFVDEYQDINAVQQAILDRLTAGGNLFGVGDVKQSIYAFRGAEPRIFQQRLARASRHHHDSDHGLLIDLNINFRSRPGILHFVNHVFGRLMNASLAGIDYDDNAALKPPAANAADDSNDSPAAEPVVELHILDDSPSDDDTDNDAPDNNMKNSSAAPLPENLAIVTSAQRQAAVIARRIEQFVGSDDCPAMQIHDKQTGQSRPVSYRDIVVLMRSLAGQVSDFAEVLRLAGIPINCQSGAGYFQTTEITDCLSLLKVLDNPRRDIELAAVLRSPFFGLTDTDLARIRSDDQQNTPVGWVVNPPSAPNPVGLNPPSDLSPVGLNPPSDPQNTSQESVAAPCFYDAVRRCAAAGADPRLRQRLAQVLDQLGQWRSFARRSALPELIWQLYRSTGYLSFVAALPNGPQRRANLLKLHDRAVQFEGFAGSAQLGSLQKFVDFIEKLLEQGEDWAPAEPDSSAEDAVRIISIHKSKGLEFPVVFLAGLDKPFNKRDLTSDCLADADYALGLRIIHPQSHRKFTSLAHQVIAEQKRTALLAEEMRILYVALTRARDRLILTASDTADNCRQMLSAGDAETINALPDWQLRSCQSSWQWLLHTLADDELLQQSFETASGAAAADQPNTAHRLFSLTLYDRDRLDVISAAILAQKRSRFHAFKRSDLAATPDDLDPAVAARSHQLFAATRDSLSWRYPWQASAGLPAKSSVTALTHRADEFAPRDSSYALQRTPRVLDESAATSQPAARSIGTAVHLVMRTVELAQPIDLSSVRSVIADLRRRGAVTDQTARAIDASAIAAFFRSELGRTVLHSHDMVLREWPFTIAVPAAQFPATDVTVVSPGTEASGEDSVIVQGIIDLIIQHDDGLTIIDFKTDSVSRSHLDEYAARYYAQLGFYATAAARILKRPVRAKRLYFLTPGIAHQVP